jgi:hypothetical protein
MQRIIASYAHPRFDSRLTFFVNVSNDVKVGLLVFLVC